MEELLSLKWNNHRSTFLHILSILRDKQLYTDATLACEGRFYSVHKLVLSTCSDYFSAIFDRTTCKNPIIVLKDIKCEDLEALLDYMYLGEVNVRQADLASLIKAAECLRVKGLAVPDDEPPRKSSRSGDNSNVRKSDSTGSPHPKRKRREGRDDGRDDVRPGGKVSPLTSSAPKTSQSRLSPVSQDPLGDGQTSSPSQLHVSDSAHTNNTAESRLNNEETPFVKVEVDDSGGDTGDGADISFNDSFKEEGDDDSGGDLNKDLPEFLQQDSSSFSHSFGSGPSYQPDLQNWQGDQVLSGNYSGLGFGPNQSQDGSQSTSGGGPDELHLTCSFCSKVISGRNRRQRLQYHLLTHSNQRSFHCPYCSYRAHLKFTMTRHIRMVHRLLCQSGVNAKGTARQGGFAPSQKFANPQMTYYGDY